MTRPFSQILGELASGRTHDKCTERMAELVERCKETGGSGSLTLMIKVKPVGDQTVEITDDIKTKLPEFSRPKSIFFIDGENSLSRSDPRQTAFNLRDIKDEQFN